jgi:hypothetical protein
MGKRPNRSPSVMRRWGILVDAALVPELVVTGSTLARNALDC